MDVAEYSQRERISVGVGQLRYAHGNLTGFETIRRPMCVGTLTSDVTIEIVFINRDELFMVIGTSRDWYTNNPCDDPEHRYIVVELPVSNKRLAVMRNEALVMSSLL